MCGFFRCFVTVACLSLAGTALASGTRGESPSDRDSGYAIQLDNDFFTGAHRDEDYSWGAAVTYGSTRPGRSTQIGILAMTPQSLASTQPLPDDRPFANLVYATRSHIRVLDDGDGAHFSSFTVGVLGLHIADTLHRTVHRALGDQIPRGWDHQISAGGVPTARYLEARQWLLSGAPRADENLPQVKFTLAGSAGFITEGSAALSVRWGRIQSPWWGFAPELGDYAPAPIAPAEHFSSQNPAERFAFAGVRLKARAYNALLQGQFRHSDVRLQGDDVAHTLAEAWVGFATTWADTRITYTLHYATREMDLEPGDRNLIWAGLAFERNL
jgi:hypothetical protein